MVELNTPKTKNGMGKKRRSALFVSTELFLLLCGPDIKHGPFFPQVESHSGAIAMSGFLGWLSFKPPSH